MADKHIGNLRAENPVPNGIINPTDLLEVFRPNNESNPAQGGVSLGGTLQQIANFTLGNISKVVLPVGGGLPRLVAEGANNPSDLVYGARSCSFVRLGTLTYITLNLAVTSLTSNGGTIRIEVPEAPAPLLAAGTNQYLTLRLYGLNHSTARVARIVTRAPFTVDFPSVQQQSSDWMLVSALNGGGAFGISGVYLSGA